MIRRLLLRIPRGLLLGFVTGLLVVGASGAHPAFAVTSVNSFINENGKCLSQENVVGTVIDVCDTTQRQDWDLKPNTSGLFTIQNSLTKGCLQPNSANRVDTATCDGSALQKWQLLPSVSGDPHFNQIGNPSRHLVMHPSGCGASNDLQIFLNVAFQCNADDWRLPGS